MNKITRRLAVKRLASMGVGATGVASVVGACLRSSVEPAATDGQEESEMHDQAQTQMKNQNPVRAIKPIGFQWWTLDPFLFCVHHDDRYPAGNDSFGPAASLAGRNIGMDFEGIDGWRMYHGDIVPGFPQHPHRGFETVTVVRRGLLDHSDSMGAVARYGEGDVQWLTAGAGINHSEMFPLLDKGAPNPVELFQIWLNLPAADKFAKPHFSMLWAPSIPVREFVDDAGKTTRVTLTAGAIGDVKAPPPPPSSWASHAEADVAIWQIKMAPGARWMLPAAKSGTDRVLYYFVGGGLQVAERNVAVSNGVVLQGDVEVALTNGAQESEMLLLQGRPIGEPVVQRGPFVMNTAAEISQAFADYQRTHFGGWRWSSTGPVHGPKPERFARRADGSEERPS